MDKGIYVAMTGAQAVLRAQAAVANNLANKDTAGFKAGRVATDTFEIPGEGLPTRVDAMPTSAGFDASPGPVRITGNDLDIALRENVWLAVAGADGAEAYTRGGELRISPNGLLTTASGRPVLGDGGPVSVPPHAKLTIGADGTLSMQPLGQGPETLARTGRLRLLEASPDALARGDDGLMRAREPLPRAEGSVVTAGALEGSNVDVAGSLVSMIELSRRFEMQVKVMRDSEEMARASASLMRLGN
ncbi:MAG: flagellar basal body rod protein FlgF [Pseudomonadota bacterium]